MSANIQEASAAKPNDLITGYLDFKITSLNSAKNIIKRGTTKLGEYKIPLNNAPSNEVGYPSGKFSAKLIGDVANIKYRL
jgi:hypothetical protein